MSNKPLDPIEENILEEWEAQLDAAGRELRKNPISQFFAAWDLGLKIKQKKLIIKAQATSAAKKGNPKESRSLFELFHAASEYANVSSTKRNLTRFAIMLLPAVILGILITWLVMGQDLHFYEQMDRHGAMILAGGILVIDIILTALWKNISMPVLRFFTTFLIGGVLTIVAAVIVLIWKGGEPGAETASLVAKIMLGVTMLFWLLWNFWPTTRKVNNGNRGSLASNRMSNNDIVNEPLNDLDSSSDESDDPYSDLEEMK